jgi:hypothetical protein
MVGYRLLRPNPALVVPSREAGLVDVFPEIGLPRVRQDYILVDKRDYLTLVQEPVTYPTSPARGEVSLERYGRFDGELRVSGDNISFRFLTGETLGGVEIRGLVSSLQGHSPDDIRRFVESLSFSE